ncbi:MAG TPA: glycosyltransferase N-terminal domain-containing protein [Acidobacteriaceae bacterium]|nr:glycosyltransferase N-terminal domain-containing protein [Acidobacteriaceae bacterium]
MMWLYSALLMTALVVSSPWWIARILTTERYREGISERLGNVPQRLREAVAGFAEQRRVVWVHAVSVGEVLAASRMVRELETALGEQDERWRVVVSTTTRTGQALARERFGADRVFYFPLDFAFAVRPYLRLLNPAALVLMESEIWPRVLRECRRAEVVVMVVNARVSDRSFARGMTVRRVWGRVLAQVDLWLTQSEEDARRLVEMGANAEVVRAIGNLKYDVRARKESKVAALIKEAAAGRQIVVAGSTTDDPSGKRASWEEFAVLHGWRKGATHAPIGALLVLAPRHPERFAAAEAAAFEFRYALVSKWLARETIGVKSDKPREVVILDTIGDLAAVYGVADVAFVGGSLVKRGGHNPLEPAQFGVPVVIGPSYENFRDIVSTMQKANAIRVVENRDELRETLVELLSNRKVAQAMGERGRVVFEKQQGATRHAVRVIVEVLRGGTP